MNLEKMFIFLFSQILINFHELNCEKIKLKNKNDDDDD